MCRQNDCIIDGRTRNDFKQNDSKDKDYLQSGCRQND